MKAIAQIAFIGFSYLAWASVKDGNKWMVLGFIGASIFVLVRLAIIRIRQGPA